MWDERVARFVLWVEENETRLVRTGVTQLLDQLRDTDPVSLEWLEDSAQLLADRLSEKGSSPSTRSTYASRLRGAVRRYVESRRPGAEPIRPGAGVGRTSAGRRPPAPSHLTPQEEINEAYAAIARWPYVRRFVLAGLQAAEAALSAGKEEEKT